MATYNVPSCLLMQHISCGYFSINVSHLVPKIESSCIYIYIYHILYVYNMKHKMFILIDAIPAFKLPYNTVITFHHTARSTPN